MKDTVLYRYPWSYAQEFGEEEQYRESMKANIACRDAIEKAIADNSEPVSGNYGHAGINFDAAAAAKQVVKEFGINRTAYVVANHIFNRGWDGRFSAKNKEWVYTIHVCVEESVFGRVNTKYMIRDAKAHSVIVDAFATKVRELHQLSKLKKTN